MKPIQKVLIVGGGTAGWLTAAYLARVLGAASADSVRITLVESKEIGIVGVGEASFPSIRHTLALLGIDEARFMRECNATFKQGIHFADWVRPPGTPGRDHYFHPFSLPSQKPGGPELLPYWLQGAAGAGVPLAEAVTMQKRIVDASRGPKRMTDGNFVGAMNYAYHFDTVRLGALLGEHARSLGVGHVLATVERVELDADGAIASVVTREAGALSADLYIDCTGFRATLIGQALGSPFRNINDVLFNDRAIAMEAPYASPDAPIPPYTKASAQEAGWIWDIGLQQRRGVGYVYSSRYTDDTRAEQVLRSYVGKTSGPAVEGLSPRFLKLNVGHRDAQWVKNCVGVGLSGGFIEPLESSGIALIEMAAYLIGQLFPFNGDTAPLAKLFNNQMTTRYARIIDFIKLHYCLTQRTDTPFWIDNADSRSIPESLNDRLAMWRCRPPHRLDFIVDLEMYPPASWQYVLYGMEFHTDFNANKSSYPRFDEARHEFEMIRKLGQHALHDLPPHRTLVEHICAQKPVFAVESK